ncbi:ferredoxin reductase family protein [Xylanimonas protaetiae]|uniref:Oxidoreductase n=1 Tax=Xylanimonas protaetiae TaxID=2509457 RepID=A0A4V0YGI9_9MICO|nr:ferredoxin reductase family protein [Xylanimonas protaetiae]QAY71371.1 oxidoreductase [Xylanimonas protaetiae]
MTSTAVARGHLRTGTRSTRRWWRAGAQAVVWVTSLVVAVTWLHGGGLASLAAGGGEAVTALGRLAGLTSANLLLYQVLLMARVPVFERGLGRDALVRAHRTTGFWSFWLLLAHVFLVTVGYAATGGVGAWTQLWDFVVTYPGMLLATAGSVLLVAVVALSVRAARRRLRYESWHLLHLYAYLGVGLAVPHQLWNGGDLLVSLPLTVYWWTLWALALACVLAFRVAVPLVRSARHQLRVAAVTPDGDRGLRVLLTGRRLERLGTRAGQHFVFRFLDGPGWTRGHPFSVALAPGPHGLALAVRVVGDGTSRLATLRPGTRVLVEGPFGTMTGESRRARHLLMLGAGAGVAPLVALLQEQPWAGGEATLVTRDSRPDDALLTGPLAELVERRGLRWFRLDGPRAPQGPAWLPAAYGAWSGPELLRGVVGRDLGDHDVYLCGPLPWMDAVRRDLAALRVPAARIHAESFDV